MLFDFFVCRELRHIQSQCEKRWWYGMRNIFRFLRTSFVWNREITKREKSNFEQIGVIRVDNWGLYRSDPSRLEISCNSIIFLFLLSSLSVCWCECRSNRASDKGEDSVHPLAGRALCKKTGKVTVRGGIREEENFLWRVRRKKNKGRRSSAVHNKWWKRLVRREKEKVERKQKHKNHKNTKKNKGENPVCVSVCRDKQKYN